MGDLFKYTNFPDEPAEHEGPQDEMADLIKENRELREANDILRTERDRLLIKVQLMKYIPVIAEIEPHHDPVYGHCFQWPAQEVDQFIAMHGE